MWSIGKASSMAFAALLVAALTLGVAAPSYAADPGKPIPPNGPTYKQYWDYKEAWNNEHLETSRNANPSPKIHPSGPAAGRTESKSTTGKPLVGRIMGPKEKITILPDIMEPKPGAGAGIGKLISPLMGILRFGIIGIGSQAIPPSNAVEVYRSQGVSETCIASASTCTPEELKKQIEVNGCTISNTCHTYATPATESPLQVQPLPADMWSILTNQSDQEELPTASSHLEWTSEGCTYIPTVVNYETPGSAGVDFEIKLNAGTPSNATQRNYYNTRCAKEGYAPRSPLGYVAYAVCADTAGSGVDVAGNPFSEAHWVSNLMPQGTIVPLCKNTAYAAKPPVNVVSLTFVQTTPMQGVAEKYSNGAYHHWVNPDPNVNSIGMTEITTSYECVDGAGNLYNYSISQKGAASWPTPNCPEGTTLNKFDVNQSNGTGTPSRRLGGANVVDGALDTYGDCMRMGCELEVQVDGQTCTVGRAECETWSQIRAKQPSRVICKWGSHIVASTNCLSLAEGYKSERGTIYDPNSDTIVSVDEDGQTSTDVNPTPWNPRNPDPTPGVITTPDTTIDTGSGTGTGTGSGTGSMTGTGNNPASNSCLSGIKFSFNPSDWVLTPLQCAFVPTKPLMSRVDTVTAALANKIPMVWFPGIGDGPGGGACPDWRVQVAGLDKNVICESSFTASIRGARVPLFNLVSVAMTWPLLRGIWYGLIPIVRVTPGK